MANLAQLKSKRGQLKSQITRINNFIQKIESEPFTDRTLCEVRLRLDRMPDILEKFENIQTEIDNLDQNESESEQIREDFETHFFETQAHLQTITNKLSKQSNECLIQQNSEISQSFQLPTMKLPTFNGDYNRWVEFRDGFEAFVGSNNKLSNIQKLHHLRSCLGEEALNIIRSIPVSSANYKQAWDALKKRFERNQLIIYSHVRVILNFPKLTKESYKDLRSFYNEINNNLEALQNLNQPVDSWDSILVPVIVDKLDPSTRREWEKHSTENNIYTVKELIKVLNCRSEILEKVSMAQSTNCNPNVSRSPIQTRPRQLLNYSANTVENSKCFLCKQSHPIFYCDKFLKLTSKQRLKEIKNVHYCTNCLKPNHYANNCRNKSTCKVCKKSHNTLLHVDNQSDQLNISEQNSNTDTKSESKLAAANSSLQMLSTSNIIQNSNSNFKTHNIHTNNQILLSTALVTVTDLEGKKYKCRAMLDTGAMSNFVTQNLVDKLGLKSFPVDITISGVGQCLMNAQSMIKLEISNENKFKKVINCLVMNNITSRVPVSSFPSSLLKIPNSIKLADPNYNISQPIDLLLGNSVFWQLLLPNMKPIPNTEIILQQTKLGWILGGSFNSKYFSKFLNKKSVNCLTLNEQLQTQLTKFWELDEPTKELTRSKSDEVCEAHFLNTIHKDESGKFVVNIPFKKNYTNLGNSRIQAEKRFHSLEKRLLKDSKLHAEYCAFMQEYIDLGHMSVCHESLDKEELNYYIPHHAVMREASLTTKLRVVFNASMKTDSGLSLNDVQHIGPTIQKDLFSILVNFRLYQFVVTADISKMYRMIWIEKAHRPFHRIFWRKNPEDKLQCFELNTVTYGTASAPYLAIRCLHQIANDNEFNYPVACKAIKENFYVDDFLYGANSIEEIINVQRDVTKLLRESGFELRKWLCNTDHLYKEFNINKDLECSILKFGENEPIKALGVAWDSGSDFITYFSLNKNHSKITKRTILSEFSKIFDPLNLLGPFTVLGKLLVQELWREKIGWDEEVPPYISEKWNKFKQNLKLLSNIKIPRHVSLPDPIEIEIHGFGDASIKAYGAAIYLKTKSPNNTVTSRLLCAKTRVAPIKQQTLPRLELCAAVLVAQLFDKIKTTSIRFHKQYFWSDSMIVLSWIKGDPVKWKTFVGNRVGEIQRLTNSNDWHHISSSDNPADRLSRGVSIYDIINDNLWWQGPDMLSTKNASYKSLPVQILDVVPETKLTIGLVTQNLPDDNILLKFSNLNKLKRTVAYCFRFFNNCKSTLLNRKFGPLTTSEINNALYSLIVLSQRKEFQNDYHNLTKNNSVSASSKLLSLNPFIDKDGVLRVGGRIKNSYCNFDKKHPIILSKNSALTKLIFKDIHERLFHCGPTQLLAAVREKYWPISGRNLSKLITRTCNICFRIKPTSCQYQLGNLPEPRVTESLPFSHVGLDYAGPFLLKDRTTRGAKFLKSYICIFVCFSTKSVHLEVVSDLTTQAFLNCFHRFISRRGKPSHIYSDNAKTFVGANKNLNEIYAFLNQNKEYIQNSLSKDNITWHFIPPRAPHFGGLWEAGVKRIKYHLTRVLGDSKLTFEHFYTVICQIESIINSRPLCPLTSNSDDLEPLTPGHFLIFRSPMSIPDTKDITLVPTNRLKLYQRILQLKQHFWNRWHKEYISELQQRTKWKKHSPEDQEQIKPGAIVIIKEKFSPCMKWPIGKVEEVHKGDDGIIRVVTLKIQGKTYQRPVSKIGILPQN